MSIAPENAASRRFLIHIGLPKTATTFLQEHVFPRHPDIVFLDQRAGNPAIPEILQAIKNDDETAWSAEAQLAVLSDELAKLEPDERPIVVSRETLSSQGGESHEVIARRLHAVFGPATILITIRRPQDLLVSSFFQYVKTINTKARVTEGQRYTDFDAWWAYQWDQRSGPRSYLPRTRFHTLATAYAEIFGLANVHVLPYELLVDDPGTFVDRLAVILEIDAAPLRIATANPERSNPRLSRYEHMKERLISVLPIAAQIGGYLPTALKQAARASNLGSSASLQMSPTIERAITDYSWAECAALAHDWNVDLARYNYPLAPSSEVSSSE